MDRLYDMSHGDSRGTVWVRGDLEPLEEWVRITGPRYWWGQLTRPRFSWVALIVIITFASLISGAMR
jgi:hypothetical protein